MKSPRIAALLVLLVVVGLVAPLRAAEPTAPVRPAMAAAPGTDGLSVLFAAHTTASRLCPTYFCPIYIDFGCSCDWVYCPDGSIACGVWDGTAATSASSVAPAALSPVQVRR